MENKNIMAEDVPLLLYYKDSIEKAKLRGCIFFYHGFTANKEKNESELKLLAENGYLAIGVDNYGHGERRFKHFEDNMFSDDSKIGNERFTDLIDRTAKEFPRLVNYLIKQKIISDEKIGVAGVSMGGMIAYRLPIIDKRVKAIVSIVSTPKWPIQHNHSPHHYIREYHPAAILSLTATKDTILPPDDTKNFHRDLAILYNGDSRKTGYKEYPKSDHMMIQEDWNDSWEETIKWFNKFL